MSLKSISHPVVLYTLHIIFQVFFNPLPKHFVKKSERKMVILFLVELRTFQHPIIHCQSFQNILLSLFFNSYKYFSYSPYYYFCFFFLSLLNFLFISFFFSPLLFICLSILFPFFTQFYLLFSFFDSFCF